MSGGDTSTRCRWDWRRARAERASVRRVLALVGGRAQPDVLLRVRGDLALWRAVAPTPARAGGPK